MILENKFLIRFLDAPNKGTTFFETFNWFFIVLANCEVSITKKIYIQNCGIKFF